MPILLWILASTFLVSLISLIGVLAFLLKERLLNKVLIILVAFSAGTLMGGAFFHLIPEAISQIGIEEGSILKLSLALLLGFCFFFVLENFINWHHHHTKEHPEIKPLSYLILISDAIHNFIDGLIIAASFIVSFPIGIVTALAVALHEIPQEIGDFGVLIYSGFSKTRTLLFNFISALTAIFGGLFGFFLSEKIGKFIIFLLPIAAGTFIYISASDLLPEIKQKVSPVRDKSLNGVNWLYFFIFLSGLGLMFLLKLL